jgi:uncharacterized protein (TIGR03437 family)
MAGVSAGLAAAQSFDNSGNGLLQGTYNFRQIVYSSLDAKGGIGRQRALSGAITFDGKGGYTVSGQLRDSTTNGTTAVNTSGTYGTAPSGLTSLDNPVISSEIIWGLVSRGVFVGSSTEGSVNDIFAAVAAGSPAAGAPVLKGDYWLAAMSFPDSSPANARDAMIHLTANGSGGITVNSVSGYVGSSSTAITTPIAGFNYTLANGSGTLSFPSNASSNALISGDRTFYATSDGNVLVGGSANGYDLIFGVRSASGTPPNSLFKGAYYLAGVDEDNSDLANSGASFDTFYGSLTATGSGTIIRTDRVAPADSAPFDFTFDSSYSLLDRGSYERSNFRYAVADGGLALLGIGKGPMLGILLGVKSPDFSGPGVYINPTGVVNAASNAPFTAGVSVGELVTIYGTGLAKSAQAAQSFPFPTTLNGVQVKINGRLAPVYAVSPTQISVVVPYETELSYAQFQVINGGVASNTSTSFVNTASPGVFTVPPGGIGYGAVLHADYSLVSKSSPAKRGEIVLLFVTGMGEVSPAVTAGSAAPSNPLAKVVNQPDIYIDGTSADVSFAGLAPGFAGLYQINVKVPDDAGPGDVSLEVDGVDGGTSQAVIPVQ